MAWDMENMLVRLVAFVVRPLVVGEEPESISSSVPEYDVDVPVCDGTR